jgi:hypothetical protein
MKLKNNKVILSITSVLLLPVSAQAATVMATLSSQDRIVGDRQSGGDALGYYAEGALTTGVAGGNPNRVNTNSVIGFTLPTLNLGESVTAANFGIEIAGINVGGAFTVALFGLTETDPDASGVTLFSQSGTGAINTAFTSTAAAAGSTPSSDVTTFIQSLYSGNTPNQSEVFFRLNQTTTMAINGTRRLNFTKDTATLSLDSAVIPEPSTALLGGVGMLLMLRRRRSQ